MVRWFSVHHRLVVRLRWLAAAFVMALLGLSGVSKCADLPYFEHDIRSWTLAPETVRVLVVLFVPPLEVAVGAAWFAGLYRKMAVGVAVFLLVGATTVYGAHLVFGVEPRCGCGGALGAFQFMQQQGPVVIARNGVLLLLLLVGAGAGKSEVLHSERVALEEVRRA